jgi:hypothetical protein
MLLLVLAAVLGTLLMIPALYVVFFFGWSPSVAVAPVTDRRGRQTQGSQHEESSPNKIS